MAIPLYWCCLLSAFWFWALQRGDILYGRIFIPLFSFGFAAGIFGFVYSAGVMEAYELLVENEQYSSRIFFRIKRKIKEKLDRI